MAIEPSEWDEAKAYAERKLKGIIEREGDVDGARRQPWYLAQLIAETVRGSRFSKFTLDLMEILEHADEYMGVKKRTARVLKHEPPITVPLLYHRDL